MSIYFKMKCFREELTNHSADELLRRLPLWELVDYLFYYLAKAYLSGDFRSIPLPILEELITYRIEERLQEPEKSIFRDGSEIERLKRKLLVFGDALNWSGVNGTFLDAKDFYLEPLKDKKGKV